MVRWPINFANPSLSSGLEDHSAISYPLDAGNTRQMSASSYIFGQLKE